MKVRRHQAIVLLVSAVLLLATFGLAVPGITVAVQDLGSGSGELFSPVSTGTICAPYALYFYAFGDWYGPYYLSGITEVYPGNFTNDLYSGTNVSATVYIDSTLESSGIRTLNSSLPAGYYTIVQIDPSIDYTHVLTGEFRVTVQPPEYTTASSGSISLTLQKLGNGIPTGEYRDYLVLYRDLGWYQIYVVVRCYQLVFVPDSLMGGGIAAIVPLLLSDDGAISLEEYETLRIPDLEERSPRRCPDLKNLRQVVIRSPYLKKIIDEITQEIERKLIEAKTENES
ncbi:hypothetical protein [Thermococcus sp. ES12]|uniref:hypothetical protein n=1 Tax=Thermococcus sp. ES12 TaxID=1638246 RepID=UPI00142FCF41|nr:hypothetical protein [Thermococcus sp. ES12]NJE76852.1 hypothetical protein [Thermococcus sp. ES12]